MKLEFLIGILIKIGVSLAIIVFSILLVKIMRFVFKKAGKKGENVYSNSRTIASVGVSIMKYVIYFFAGCSVLSYWGVNVSSLIAIGGVASLSVGMGAQNIIKDMLSGFFILSENQFVIGDVIKIGDFQGKVESIGLRTTVIRGLDGDVHIIPNGSIDIVTNMSKSFNRAVVDISVAYSEDIDKVIAVIKDELKRVYEEKEIEDLIDEPKVLGVEELAESSVTIRIVADCEVGTNWQAERELRRILKNRLDKDNIEIPYPYLNVRMEK